MNQQKIDRFVRAVTAVGLGVLAGYFIWLIASRSAEPRAYFEHRGGLVGQWQYPIASVVVSGALLLGEAVVVWMVLGRPKVALWKKSLLAFGITLPAALLGTVMLMHSPPYFGLHALWLVSIAICLLALFLLAGVVRLTSAVLSHYRRTAG